MKIKVTILDNFRLTKWPIFGSSWVVMNCASIGTDWSTVAIYIGLSLFTGLDWTELFSFFGQHSVFIFRKKPTFF